MLEEDNDPVNDITAKKIRKATTGDLPALMNIFTAAKGIMRASGNMHQWGGGYPSEDVVRCDIERGVCYVASKAADGEIEATMALIPGPDPTYSVIEDGNWLNDNHYYVTHESRRRGISATAFVNMIIDQYRNSSEGNIIF